MSLSIGTLLLKCHYSILGRTVNRAGRLGSAEKTEGIVAGLTVLAVPIPGTGSGGVSIINADDQWM
jgi:hypothetical protein